LIVFRGHLAVTLAGLFLAVVLAVSQKSFSRHEAKYYWADISGGIFLAKPSFLKGNHMAFVCSFLRPCHSLGNIKANLLSSFCSTSGQLPPDTSRS
jgi:hypothetical protein